jgi:aminomuconate-semialdehyde/2-hydroxymuconate-6-semialdehyde dehydrogenase
VDVLQWIDGEECAAQDGATLPNTDPATGAPIGTLPDAAPEDVDRAAQAAHAALTEWSGRTVEERAALLERLAALVERDLDALARAECVDSGKPLALARGVEIPRAAANLRFFAQAVREWAPHGGHADLAMPGARSTVTRAPAGVAGCISPWNLPLYLFTWKIAPALAAGCTVVAKPSEEAPTTAWLLGRLAREAGFPPGALNIVQGRGARAGAAIVAHPLVSAITFTGGTETGRAIMRVAGPSSARMRTWTRPWRVRSGAPSRTRDRSACAEAACWWSAARTPRSPRHLCAVRARCAWATRWTPPRIRARW